MSALSTPPRRSAWRWISFFLILAMLAVAAITLPIVYNLAQQLTPERLEHARQRWREKGPKDYDLIYSVLYDRERLPERHIVLVRGGEVVFASCEGEVVALSPALAAAVGLPAGGLSQSRARDIPAIFAHVEELLAEESVATRRNYLVALFDPREGYPRRIIRRLRGTSTREEWNVLVWPAGALAEKAVTR